MTKRSPRRIRLHEVPAFAWITACAFTPASLPLWIRYALAVLTWPASLLFPLALGLKSIYRTDDFSGVAIMHRKKGAVARMAIRSTLLCLCVCALVILPFVLNAPRWVFGLYPYAVAAAQVALAWIAAGVLALLLVAWLEGRGEGRSKLAPKGAEAFEVDGPVFVISGVAKRIGRDSGMGVTFRLARSLIRSLPEGSYVSVQPRTGGLRDAYAKQGFIPSGRKDMVLRVPATRAR